MDLTCHYIRRLCLVATYLLISQIHRPLLLKAILVLKTLSHLLDLSFPPPHVLLRLFLSHLELDDLAPEHLIIEH